ncbi:MAG: Tol-Pal system beta propeller repeat protein TolB [Candidatus Zixiibacteriota bacterium]
MIKNTILLSIVMLVAAMNVVIAQPSADISARIIQEGEIRQYPISVEDFRITSMVSSPDDIRLAQQISQIIRDDLSFHMLFKEIPIDSFILSVLELTEMTKLAWKHMGAEYLVTGRCTIEGSEVEINYTIRNLVHMSEMRSDGFRSSRDNLRALAHSVSDDVVKQVAGMKPLFNTKIAYVSAKSGNKEIYVCDYDGHSSYAVTSNGSINLSPVWDAQGKSILYTSFKGGFPELWRANIGSANHSKVASYKGLNSAAAISPTNDEICLTLSKDGNAELYLLDMNGKIKRRLTNSRAIESSPSFGPNSRTIAFSSDRTGTPQVYLMDDEGLDVTRVTYRGSYNDSPAFSPDGSKIAFVTRSDRGNFDICVVDVTGENFRLITRSGSNENPHWAPDSYHLVYSARHNDNYDLFITDFMGLTRRQISSDSKSSNPFWGPNTKR